jgi:antitoxin ParD1/3/4
METIDISLPVSMKEFIEEQVADGGYKTVSDYVQALVREDQKRKAQEKLEALLLEGLEGEGTVVTEAWWEEFRSRVTERHNPSISFASRPGWGQW